MAVVFVSDNSAEVQKSDKSRTFSSTEEPAADRVLHLLFRRVEGCHTYVRNWSIRRRVDVLFTVLACLQPPLCRVLGAQAGSDILMLLQPTAAAYSAQMKSLDGRHFLACRRRV